MSKAEDMLVKKLVEALDKYESYEIGYNKGKKEGRVEALDDVEKRLQKRQKLELKKFEKNTGLRLYPDECMFPLSLNLIEVEIEKLKKKNKSSQEESK
jgi:hypothetical protein